MVHSMVHYTVHSMVQYLADLEPREIAHRHRPHGHAELQGERGVQGLRRHAVGGHEELRLCAAQACAV